MRMSKVIRSATQIRSDSGSGMAIGEVQIGLAVMKDHGIRSLRIRKKAQHNLLILKMNAIEHMTSAMVVAVATAVIVQTKAIVSGLATGH